jgi:hypothetical protein
MEKSDTTSSLKPSSLHIEPEFAASEALVMNGQGSDKPITRVEAIIQPSRFESVKKALHEIGVEGMTVSEVQTTS